MITTDEFIKQYNKCVDWNLEIRKNLNIEVLESNPIIKELLDDYLDIKKITPEGYDVEKTVLYEVGVNRYELQILEYESMDIIYFWCTPNISKKKYIKERMKIVSDHIEGTIMGIQTKMKELQNDLDCLNILSQGLNI